MAWSFEFRAGLVWALIIAILMILALWLTKQVGNIAPLLIPILVYVGWLGWVFRLKK